MGNLKYTYEEVKLEFKNKGYTLLSKTFTGVTQKLDYICNKHKDFGVQQITFSKLHSCNQGCKKCGLEKSGISRRIQFDYQADKQLAESKGFEYVGTIRDNGIIYIEFICNNHKELGIQKMRKANMERNINGCQYCSGKNLPKDYVMDKMKEVNPNVELLEEYIGLTNRIKCRCIIHNVISYKTPQEILSGRGCFECGKEKLHDYHTRDTMTIQQKIWDKNPHINLVNEYDGCENNILCYCTKHNKNFNRHLESITKRESGCDECYKEFIRETQGMGIDEFKRRLSIVHPEINVLGEYVNNNTPIKVKCMKHNYEYSLTPTALLSKLNCCEKARVTYKEESVCEVLESWGYKITRQKKFSDCIDIRCLPFDCFLDDFNILIEYDGEQHFRPVKYSSEQYEEAVKKYNYTISHDKIKNEYCKRNNIKLIRIPFWEFENLQYFLFEKLVKEKAIIEIKNVA